MTLIIWLFIVSWVLVIALGFLAHALALIVAVVVLLMAFFFVWRLQPRILQAREVPSREERLEARETVQFEEPAGR